MFTFIKQRHHLKLCLENFLTKMSRHQDFVFTFNFNIFIVLLQIRNIFYFWVFLLYSALEGNDDFLGFQSTLGLCEAFIRTSPKSKSKITCDVFGLNKSSDE